MEPTEQANLPRPRAGFWGAIDGRLDCNLLGRVAALRPELQIVMVGPVVNIDAAALPRAANIHWLGARPYDQLPGIIRGWNVALLPFAHNTATRFMNPPATPSYLAAGKPIVSTSIPDVIHPYGLLGLARIADRAESFALAIEEAIAEDPTPRLRAADRLLGRMSWNRTWGRMDRQLALLLERRRVLTSPAALPLRLRRSAQSAGLAYGVR